MTTRTAPPRRRSTCASGVSQSGSAWNQRRSTSSLVQASKTASAGAWKARSICSVPPLIARPLRGAAGSSPSMLAPPAGRCRDRPRSAAAPPAATRRRGRGGSRAAGAALGGGGVGEGGLEVGRVVVFVVAVPPDVGLGLRVALRRVLPDLLATERGDVEVGPGGAERLVAALVDEVGAVDPAVVVAVEGVGAVPFVDAEVGVEAVGDRVPGHLPAHPLLQARDLGLRRAADVGEGGVAGVEVGEVGDLVGHQRAAAAAGLGPAVDAGLEEEAVEDELAAALEEVEQADRPVRPLEAV